MSRLHIQSDGTGAGTYVTVDDKLLDDVYRIEVLSEGRAGHTDYTHGQVLVRLTLLPDDVEIDTDRYDVLKPRKKPRRLSNNSS